MSQTKLDPLAERERLKKERKAAYSARDAAASKLDQMSVEQGRRRKGVVDALAAHSRGHDGAAEEVAEAEARLAEMDGEIERLKLTIEGAAQAQKAVEQELTQLHRDHLTEFAEAADAKTRAAAEAWEALRGPYQAAFAAHIDAVQAWGPLRHALGEELKRHEDEIGEWRPPARNAEAVLVPEWPLDEPSDAFAEQVVARPPAIQLVADEDN